MPKSRIAMTRPATATAGAAASSASSSPPKRACTSLALWSGRKSFGIGRCPARAQRRELPPPDHDLLVVVGHASEPKVQRVYWVPAERSTKNGSAAPMCRSAGSGPAGASKVGPALDPALAGPRADASVDVPELGEARERVAEESRRCRPRASCTSPSSRLVCELPLHALQERLARVIGHSFCAASVRAADQVGLAEVLEHAARHADDADASRSAGRRPRRPLAVVGEPARRRRRASVSRSGSGNSQR